MLATSHHMKVKALLLSRVKMPNGEQNVQKGTEKSGKRRKKKSYFPTN